MKELSFIIDGQPMSKKRNYRIIRIGQHYALGLKREYKAWEKNITDQLWVQRMQYMASMVGVWKPIDMYVEASFEFFMKNKAKYDLSNLIQGVEDALVKAKILKDDSLIASYDGSRKHLGCAEPRVLVTIRPFKC